MAPFSPKTFQTFLDAIVVISLLSPSVYGYSLHDFFGQSTLPQQKTYSNIYDTNSNQQPVQQNSYYTNGNNNYNFQYTLPFQQRPQQQQQLQQQFPEGGFNYNGIHYTSSNNNNNNLYGGLNNNNELLSNQQIANSPIVTSFTNRAISHNGQQFSNANAQNVNAIQNYQKPIATSGLQQPNYNQLLQTQNLLYNNQIVDTIGQQNQLFQENNKLPNQHNFYNQGLQNAITNNEIQPNIQKFSTSPFSSPGGLTQPSTDNNAVLQNQVIQNIPGGVPSNNNQLFQNQIIPSPATPENNHAILQNQVGANIPGGNLVNDNPVLQSQPQRNSIPGAILGQTRASSPINNNIPQQKLSSQEISDHEFFSKREPPQHPPLFDQGEVDNQEFLRRNQLRGRSQQQPQQQRLVENLPNVPPGCAYNAEHSGINGENCIEIK